LSPSGGSELGLIDEEDDVSDEQSTAKTSAERSVQQGLERARELNEQIMQAARKAGEEFFQRYVSWLEAIANEQQKLASSPHISQMDWLAGMLNSQAEFARKFASTLKDFSGRTTELVQEQVKQAEEAEKERARQARAAERQQAREARQAARRRYEGKTKAELSEELSTRELPKTGTVEELIERLVEADTQQ
jgi:vacuolar-type H+-ATPase subunit H